MVMFIVLQIATFFVLLGGGAAIRFALIATCAPALAVAAVAIGEVAIVVAEIVVVGKNFLLDPLREIFTPDEVPYPSHEAAADIELTELLLTPRRNLIRRLKEERAEFTAGVLEEALEERFVKEQLHGFELFRFGCLLPKVRRDIIAAMDRDRQALDDDPNLKKIKGLLVREHLQAGRREAALACT